MAWTAPMTAVASTAFTAAQFNAHIRDNLLETAPAKATTAGRIFVATGANSIVERATETASVNTQETTASASYTDLTTPGPSITVTTGAKAICFITVQMSCSSAGATVSASVDISGATTAAASDTRRIQVTSGVANDSYRTSIAHILGGLNSGSNTFKLQYRTSAGTGTFLNRNIVVIAL